MCSELRNVHSYYNAQYSAVEHFFELVEKRNSLLERPTLESRVPLFLLGHFQTNEGKISDFCL